MASRLFQLWTAKASIGLATPAVHISYGSHALTGAIVGAVYL